MTVSVRVDAPAKVNLFLRVLGRRADGFHEIETLFQAVELHDRVVLTPTSSGVELDLAGPDLGPVEENLAVRAARAFLGAVGRPAGVRIRLEKRIPAGAGLGGGSSDAAAVLRGLAALVPGAVGTEELLGMGAALGSDVAFFLGEVPLALARGRGERLLALQPLEERAMVLVLPPVHVATGRAYEALDRQRRAGVGPADDERRLPGTPPAGWDEVALRAYNDFESVVPLEHPQIARSLAALSATGGRPSLLAGSGAACFALFSDSAAAAEAAAALSRELGWPACATRTLTRFPAPEAAAPGRSGRPESAPGS